MRFNITADFTTESGIAEVLHKITDTGYFQYFKAKFYGDGLVGVCIVLVCQDKILNLKQRIRHSKKEKKIFIDIMLDLIEYSNANIDWRIRTTLNKILEVLPVVLKKYNIKDFNTEMFLSDVINWFFRYFPKYVIESPNSTH